MAHVPRQRFSSSVMLQGNGGSMFHSQKGRVRDGKKHTERESLACVEWLEWRGTVRVRQWHQGRILAQNLWVLVASMI